MEARAQARFQRIAPRKVRLVVGLLRNRRVSDAREELSVLPKRAALTVRKVLESAVANAKQNGKMNVDDLVITRAYVDEGPALKRWRPRAFGRASEIRKRTSHITIVVGAKREKRHKKQDTNKLKDTHSKDKPTAEKRKETEKKDA